MRPVIFLIFLVLVGCTSNAASNQQPVIVGAASSLVDVLEMIGAQAEADLDHPVELSIAGSQILVTSVEAGAPLDVIIVADLESLQNLDVSAEPEPFASNQLAIIVPEGNPDGITGLADLQEQDRIVLAAQEVPVGRYTARLLAERNVSIQPIAYELSARGVVSRVASGEANVGIAYRSDGNASDVDAIAISDSATTYWIGVLTERAQTDRFVEYLYSETVTTTLRSMGFTR